MKNALLWFWISKVNGWTWRRHEQLTERYGDLASIADALRTDRKKVDAILTDKVRREAESMLDERALSREFDEIIRSGIEIVTPEDEDFPEGVATLSYDRPYVLYTVGDRALFRTRGVSVVGTRRNTFYGEKQTKRFVEAFCEKGLTIVSGLADGIDTHAHRACLDCGGNTIAVLGSGLRKVTPTGNIPLARAIVRAGGLIVSEFEPEEPGSKYSFPHRNRIIAALSEGVLLPEAGERSGALYTVWHAVEQGKNVWLVPGNVDAVNSGAWIKCWRDGTGTIVAAPDDVLSELGFDGGEQIAMTLPLDKNRQKILDSLEQTALNYDSLYELVGLDHAQLSVLLTDMELSGLIESRGTLYYKK